jgi:hypothetical protein
LERNGKFPAVPPPGLKKFVSNATTLRNFIFPKILFHQNSKVRTKVALSLGSHPTIACKNNETFHIFGHFKVRRPPPCPHDQCWKKWVEFSLFSHSHNVELGMKGAFMRLSQYFLLLIVSICTFE